MIVRSKVWPTIVGPIVMNDHEVGQFFRSNKKD